jgi:hypothetical protein
MDAETYSALAGTTCQPPLPTLAQLALVSVARRSEVSTEVMTAGWSSRCRQMETGAWSGEC